MTMKLMVFQFQHGCGSYETGIGTSLQCRGSSAGPCEPGRQKENSSYRSKPKCQRAGLKNIGPFRPL